MTPADAAAETASRDAAGPPKEVCRQPADRFVASFIGAPKMNFLPAHLAQENGGLRLRIADEIGLTPTTSDAYAGRVGREVEIGLRPEHIAVRPSPEDAAPERSSPFPVKVVEPLGAETLVLTTIAGAEVVARCDPGLHPRPGDRLTAEVDTARLHLIDPDGGRVIGR